MPIFHDMPLAGPQGVPSSRKPSNSGRKLSRVSPRASSRSTVVRWLGSSQQHYRSRRCNSQIMLLCRGRHARFPCHTRMCPMHLRSFRLLPYLWIARRGCCVFAGRTQGCGRDGSL